MPDVQRLDAIIIGTGQGGKPLAGALAEAGWQCAIVERHGDGVAVTVRHEGEDRMLVGSHLMIVIGTTPNTDALGPEAAGARKRMPMTRVARAIEMNETRGFMKAVVDADSDEILGGTILGIWGGEVVTVLQMAMMGGLPWTRLRDAVIAHPTLAESLNNLFMTLD